MGVPPCKETPILSNLALPWYLLIAWIYPQIQSQQQDDITYFLLRLGILINLQLCHWHPVGCVEHEIDFRFVANRCPLRIILPPPSKHVRGIYVLLFLVFKQEGWHIFKSYQLFPESLFCSHTFTISSRESQSTEILFPFQYQKAGDIIDTIGV